MKIGLFTGASSGIGREMAVQVGAFYRSLDEIWLIARRAGKLEQLAKKLPVPVRILSMDLTKDDAIGTLQRKLSDTKPDIRLLCVAAGFGKQGGFLDIADKEETVQEEMIDLNCRALTSVIRVCLPYMNSGARLIPIASAAAFIPQPQFAVYSATKAYVLSLSRALSKELSCRHIFVTAVCPGPVDTEVFDRSGTGALPLKKLFMASPEDVAAKALLDARRRRDVSVYGLPVQLLRILCRLFPVRLLLAVQSGLAALVKAVKDIRRQRRKG